MTPGAPLTSELDPLNQLVAKAFAGILVRKDLVRQYSLAERAKMVVLGNTPTLTAADRAFVKRLASKELTQEEFRALLQVHRHTQADKASLRQLIGQLSADQWRSVACMAALLKLKPSNLSDRHLTPMLNDGRLERCFPDIPSHPDQAYRPRPSPASAVGIRPEQEEES